MKIVYEVISRRQSKVVAVCSTRKGARRSADRRDLEYGAYDHYVREGTRPLAEAEAVALGLVQS
jgi:hypothetical protein